MTPATPSSKPGSASSTTSLTSAEFEAWIQALRPELHRYATRMTGSVIDGEDVVQEALVKAYASLPLLTHDTNLRGWMFRITHNKAIDLLRRDSHEPMELLDEVPMTELTDRPLEQKELAELALSMFLKLAPRQRSCVILKDVLDYSLVEISEHLDATVPEIKATLHRGRARLRELAAQAEVSVPRLSPHEQARLADYVERFNARDFDALRAMLANEVRLDLIGRTTAHGIAEVAERYFHRYKEADDCRFSVGTVEGRPAILAYDFGKTEFGETRSIEMSTQPAYFLLLSWDQDRVSLIRDYRYARYVMRDAAITLVA